MTWAAYLGPQIAKFYRILKNTIKKVKELPATINFIADFARLDAISVLSIWCQNLILEFGAFYRWVASQMTFDKSYDASVFETTIRYRA